MFHAIIIMLFLFGNIILSMVLLGVVFVLYSSEKEFG